jgi:hypothetical protein
MPKYLDNLENITSDIQDYNKCILLIYDTYDTLSYSILDMIANYDEIKNYNLIITNKTNLKIDMLNKLNLNYFSQLHISQYYNIFTQINNLNDFEVPYFYFFVEGIIMYKTFYNSIHDINYNVLKHILVNFFNNNNNMVNFSLLMDNYSLKNIKNEETKILKKEEIIKDIEEVINIYSKSFCLNNKKIDIKNEYTLDNIKNIKVYI